MTAAEVTEESPARPAMGKVSNIAKNATAREKLLRTSTNGSILKSGKEGCRVQVFSVRNGKRLPLMCESDGIKRLISFIQLLIVSYNNPFCTLVIDEIDSGIFEYLLGELLKIVTTEGKGQMIFTSHNLRPLETI